MSFGALGILVATVPVEFAVLAVGWRAVFVGLTVITLAVAGLILLAVPEPRRALANACIMSFGALGILVATVPVELAVGAVGWRAVFVGLALITLAIAGLILVAVPERAEGRGEGLARQIMSIAPIFRDRVFWRLAPLLALTAATHIAIQTLWAGPWLRDVAGLDRMAVANHLMVMAIAFLIGILSSGVVADWLGRRGVDLITVMLGFLAVFFVAQLAIVLQLTSLTLPIWFLFGMFGQVAVLAYPWLSSHYGAELSGRTNTAVNLLLFLAAFAVQYAIGAIIDLFPSTADGYSPEGYRWGFGVFLGLQLLALLWYLAGRRLLAGADAKA